VAQDIEIAVIDDDDSFRAALVESLSSLGYEADGYASAEDFFGATGSRSYNCVVTDIHMPGTSGLELMQRLKAQKSEILIIAITARSDMSLAARAIAGGASCFLRKPFEINELIACISRAVPG
jgi:FixJ family two-component response regulator